VVLPAQVEDALSNVKVLNHYELDQFPSGWSSKNVKAVDGMVEIPYISESNWIGGPNINERQGVLFRFRYDAAVQLYFAFEFGEFNTAEFKAIGIHRVKRTGDFEYSFEQGTGQLSDPISTTAYLYHDRWYYGLLAIDDVPEFLALVWEDDNPSRMASYRRTLGEDWANRKWEFFMWSNWGTWYLDTLTVLSFSQFTER
jgi:hypothetical protein